MGGPPKWTSLSVLVLIGCGPPPSSGSERLELVEVSSVRIPDSLVITQGYLSDGGEALLWGPDNVWVVRGDRTEQICESAVPDALAARLTAPGSIEVVIGAPAEGFLKSEDGRCQTTVLEFGPDELKAATFMDDRWIGLTAGSRLLDISSDGRAWGLNLRSESIGNMIVSRSDSLPIWIAPARGGVLIALRTPPFTWVFIPIGSNEAVHNQSTYEGPPGSGQMVSTGVLSIDGGFLQVIADLTSNRRVLLLFDPWGHRVRETELAVPFGLLAENHKTRRILALRRTDKLEVVIYRYAFAHRRGQ